MNKSLHTQWGTIEYAVARKKMKNMRLRIEQGRVIVSCARTVQIKSIETFIIKHIQWIMDTKQKIEQKKFGILPTEYKEGESFHYLGEAYTLKNAVGDAKKAVLCGQILLLPKSGDAQESKKAFFKWLAKEAGEVFEERFDSLYAQFERQIGPKPLLKLRRMKSRWGSANIRKRIVTLNTALIFAPVKCIDYVAAHELCHFIHANHSKEFYAELAMHMPDWKERRAYLNSHYSLDL
jgi:predicted metal-dependent hydrolase